MIRHHLKIATIMKPGARLLLDSHVSSENPGQACFIENAFWGDTGYGWIFGDECLTAMLRSAGFRDVVMPLKVDCNSRNPSNPKFTVEGHPAGARAWFIATRA